MKIYLRLHEKPKTLADLLKALFSHHSTHILVKGVATYFDEECKFMQCRDDKFRSFDDVMIIARTYFPRVSTKKILQTVLKLDIRTRGGTPCELGMSSCHTMSRIRMYYMPEVSNYDSVVATPKHSSKYSWKELLHSIGITSQYALEAFRKDKE